MEEEEEEEGEEETEVVAPFVHPPAMAIPLPKLLLPLSFCGFLLAALCCPCLVALAGTSEDDARALLQWKKGIENDPLGFLLSWKEAAGVADDAVIAINPCSWRGVSCSPFANRVVKLQLPNGRLSGRFCSHCLASLDLLQMLDLSGNALSGNFSGFDLGPLAPSCHLQSVNLSGNQLVGGLPEYLFHSCGRIQELDLSFNRLHGSLPEGFCGASLKTLNLSQNLLDGNLPSFVGHCSSLQVLDISANNISGSIPDSLFASCAGLVSLDLSMNSFRGLIPSTLGHSCVALRELNLSRNKLDGALPPSLGNLSLIEHLDISGNLLSGEIPSEFSGFCSSLIELDLSNNAISGHFPESLSACSSLEVINLSKNNLSGLFPAVSVISGLHSLWKLSLGSNSFTGLLPRSIGDCVNLKVLDLSSNGFSGAIPVDLCAPKLNLEQLHLKNNRLSGGIPPSLSNCSQLKLLDLSYNLLGGAIPTELALLSELEMLSMWYNKLNGSIPAEFGAMPKLRSLVLNDNFLSGTIPVELTNCTSLEWLSLSSNRLVGEIPRQIDGLERLTLLELAENSLSGELPSELGNCSYLLWLDVHSNRLEGPINWRLGRYADGPPTIRLLDGDNVAFVRYLDSACAGLGRLVEFAGMSEPALSRTPLVQSCASAVRLYDGPTLGDDPDYSTIQYIDLSRNRFSGSIPGGLGHMRALQMLDLSHNSLAGPIPVLFGELARLGVLDLSHNHLDGSLWPLANCTFLVQLDVSFNNFSGTIPSVGQLSTAPESNFAGNPYLCGPPLSTCGGNRLPNANTPPPCATHTSCIRAKMAAFSWQNNLILAVMVAVAFAGLVLAWAILVARARNKSKVESAAAAGIMLGGLRSSPSWRGSSGWNFTGEKEPLSINVATFERPLRKLTFSQLIEATNGFNSDSLIGTGGFGEVYKATLRDGSVVAIKKLVQCSYQGDREFIAEMETLGKIKHRNLVPLLGYCKVGEERLLVYEYMHGGSLEDLLHTPPLLVHNSSTTRPRPRWEVRKQIAKGAARGLAFLHHNCIPHIIHRDMKSSNVLLDENLEARVSDFGMARLISALDTHLSVSTLAGTPGYVPPEYYQSFRCTAKGDVYSFGVVLLELLTGKRPTDKEEFGDSNLVGWVKLHAKQKRGAEVLDPCLTDQVTTSNPFAPTITTTPPTITSTTSNRDQDDGVHGTHICEMMHYLYLACECLEDVASRRPTMLQVVARLKEISAEC